MNIDLDSLLPQLIPDSNTHAKWLNTLSYLEYIGFRKIVKSHPAENLSIEDLTHALEEGRHALRLKRLAVKTGGSDFRFYSPTKMIAKIEADHYFQSLDRACSDTTRDQKLTYHYVTLLVEIRALEVYQIYDRHLEKLHLFSLKSLLNEEELHLQNVRTELERLDRDLSTRFENFKVLEAELYTKFLNAVNRSIHPPELAYA